jgi:hypothetical protein
MTTKHYSPLFLLPLQTRKKLLRCLTVLLPIVLVSCTDSTVLPTDIGSVSTAQVGHTNISNEDRQEADASLKELAIAVAAILENNDDRALFHKKVLQRFDGDTDILWTDLEDDQEFFTQKKKKWSDLVIEKKATKFKTSNDVKKAIDQIEKVIGGKLHLYWASAEKWNGTTAPIVCFIEIGKNPYKDQEVTAYDARGNTITVNERISKERPVIVLIRNERTDEFGKVKKGMLASETPKNIGKKGDSVSQIFGMTKFRLIAPHFEHDYESWFNGDPEFYAVIKKRASHQGVANSTWAAEWAMWNNGFPGISSGECGSNNDGNIYIWRMADYNITYDWYYMGYSTLDIIWMENDPLWGRGLIYLPDQSSVEAMDTNDDYVWRMHANYTDGPNWVWQRLLYPTYYCRHLNWDGPHARGWFAW